MTFREAKRAPPVCPAEPGSGRPEPQASRRAKSLRALDLAALAALLALAASLRVGTLGLLHDRGDQLVWAALARNVSDQGLAGYTIRGIDTRWQVVPGSDEVALARAEPATVGSGTLVSGLVAAGEGYWDAPLANQPPGFTALLVASHRLLGRADDGFPLLGRAPVLASARPGGATAEEALARRTVAAPPPGVVRAQLWATLPPLVSDLATVALLWLAGVRILRSRRAGLVAAAAFATDPLALFCSHRLLSNSTLATLCLATALAWHESERLEGRRRLLGLALAGAVAGFAIAVKFSAVFLVPAAVVAAVFPRRRGLLGISLFAAIPLVLNAPWWLLQWKALGNPFGFAWEKTSHWPEGSAWGALVTERGLDYYPFILLHSPLVFAGAIQAIAVLARPRERERLGFVAAFVLLVLLAAHLHSGGKEARHLILVYPACLVVAASGVERARQWFAAATRSPFLARAVVGVGLALVFFVQGGVGLGWAWATAHVP
jgi:hypothetical protein